MKIILSILLTFIGHVVEGGHYLVWIPAATRSVKIGIMEVGEELARRGHQVTVISPHPYKHVPPGVTEITISSAAYDAFQNGVSDDVLTNPNAASLPVAEFIQLGLDLNREALMSVEVKSVLDKKDTDVLITIPIFSNEAANYLAHRTNSTLAYFITAPYSFPNLNYAVGDPYNPSYLPHPLLGITTQKMTFLQRCKNTLIVIAQLALRLYYVLPKTEALLAEAYPDDDIPSLDDLGKNVALLINHGSPFTGDGLRPVMPKTIMAGLMSCSPAAPLPADLQTFVEQSKYGVVYVSFGSVVKASKMPESKRKAMLSVFSKLKQRVIWKWEKPMDDAPANVMISSWLPQTSLLAHDNVKVFITHGGAGSVQETICHKTPIVGVPFGGDQFPNVNEAVAKKIGVKVDWHSMTEESLLAAVTSVLSDTSYQDGVNVLSDLIMDQPQHPLDRAIWWLEYLLRHPHNINMRPVSHDLYWFQYFLLDVIAVISIILATVIYILWKIVKLCCCSSRKVKRE